MVSGIVYVIVGLVVCDWSGEVEFTKDGGSTGELITIADFAENWFKRVYMCQDDTFELLSLSDHSFKSYDQKSKCPIYVYHWMRRIRFV